MKVHAASARRKTVICKKTVKLIWLYFPQRLAVKQTWRLKAGRLKLGNQSTCNQWGINRACIKLLFFPSFRNYHSTSDELEGSQTEKTWISWKASFRCLQAQCIVKKDPRRITTNRTMKGWLLVHFDPNTKWLKWSQRQSKAFWRQGPRRI